jgi:hypothetical protein
MGVAKFLDNFLRTAGSACGLCGFAESLVACRYRGSSAQRNQSEMPTPRTNRAGRYSCITFSMQEALLNELINKPYLYRCEMADFFYRKFRQRVSERSIGRLLRSKGWTRKTIHRIAQQSYFYEKPGMEMSAHTSLLRSSALNCCRILCLFALPIWLRRTQLAFTQSLAFPRLGGASEQLTMKRKARSVYPQSLQT